MTHSLARASGSVKRAARASCRYEVRAGGGRGPAGSVREVADGSDGRGRPGSRDGMRMAGCRQVVAPGAARDGKIKGRRREAGRGPLARGRLTDGWGTYDTSRLNP
eukprot:7388837-Prymnesium_polylepis.1